MNAFEIQAVREAQRINEFLEQAEFAEGIARAQDRMNDDMARPMVEASFLFEQRALFADEAVREAVQQFSTVSDAVQRASANFDAIVASAQKVASEHAARFEQIAEAAQRINGIFQHHEEIRRLAETFNARMSSTLAQIEAQAMRVMPLPNISDHIAQLLASVPEPDSMAARLIRDADGLRVTMPALSSITAFPLMEFVVSVLLPLMSFIKEQEAAASNAREHADIVKHVDDAIREAIDSMKAIARIQVAVGPVTARKRLHLRSGPSAAYASLSVVTVGRAMKVLDVNGRWLEVEFFDNDSSTTYRGWVYGPFTEPLSDSGTH